MKPAEGSMNQLLWDANKVSETSRRKAPPPGGGKQLLRRSLRAQGEDAAFFAISSASLERLITARRSLRCATAQWPSRRFRGDRTPLDGAGLPRPAGADGSSACTVTPEGLVGHAGRCPRLLTSALPGRVGAKHASIAAASRAAAATRVRPPIPSRTRDGRRDGCAFACRRIVANAGLGRLPVRRKTRRSVRSPWPTSGAGTKGRDKDDLCLTRPTSATGGRRYFCRGLLPHCPSKAAVLARRGPAVHAVFA